jgi:hypothetical protein
VDNAFDILGLGLGESVLEFDRPPDELPPLPPEDPELLDVPVPLLDIPLVQRPPS